MSDLRKMKGGKASGLNGTTMELIKYGGDNIIEWLMKFFSRCMEKVTAPEDWKI